MLETKRLLPLQIWSGAAAHLFAIRDRVKWRIVDPNLSPNGLGLINTSNRSMESPRTQLYSYRHVMISVVMMKHV